MRSTLQYILITKSSSHLFLIIRQELFSFHIIRILLSHVLEPLHLSSACVMSIFYFRKTWKKALRRSRFLGNKVWKLLHSYLHIGAECIVMRNVKCCGQLNTVNFHSGSTESGHRCFHNCDVLGEIQCSMVLKPTLPPVWHSGHWAVI